VTYADAAHNAALMTALERAQQARIEELELRLAKMEKMYDKVAADLIEALDVASAYRATASTMHQEIERRNGVERRQTEKGDPAIGRRIASYAYPDRRKSWPR
jgi:uncharacterized coiled-coil protein SlyX